MTDKCQCGRFDPDLWRRDRCKTCFHSNAQHTPDGCTGEQSGDRATRATSRTTIPASTSFGRLVQKVMAESANDKTATAEKPTTSTTATPAQTQAETPTTPAKTETQAQTPAQTTAPTTTATPAEATGAIHRSSSGLAARLALFSGGSEQAPAPTVHPGRGASQPTLTRTPSKTFGSGALRASPGDASASKTPTKTPGDSSVAKPVRTFGSHVVSPKPPAVETSAESTTATATPMKPASTASATVESPMKSTSSTSTAVESHEEIPPVSGYTTDITPVTSSTSDSTPMTVASVKAAVLFRDPLISAKKTLDNAIAATPNTTVGSTDQRREFFRELEAMSQRIRTQTNSGTNTSELVVWMPDFAKHITHMKQKSNLCSTFSAVITVFRASVTVMSEILCSMLKGEKMIDVIKLDTSITGYNCLHVCALIGSANVMQQCISQASAETLSKLNAPTAKEKLFPVHIATILDNCEMLEILRGAGNTLVTPKFKGDTIAHLAVRYAGSRKMLQLVCSEPYIALGLHEGNQAGDFPLHLLPESTATEKEAIWTESFSCCSLNLSSQDSNGCTILHRAIAALEVPIVKMLLSSDALDPNAVDKLERTCWHHALTTLAKTGVTPARISVLQLLLGCPRLTNINKPDSKGLTPIQMATAAKATAVIQLLCSGKGVEISVTTLDCAAKYGAEGWPLMDMFLKTGKCAIKGNKVMEILLAGKNVQIVSDVAKKYPQVITDMAPTVLDSIIEKAVLYKQLEIITILVGVDKVNRFTNSVGPSAFLRSCGAPHMAVQLAAHVEECLPLMTEILSSPHVDIMPTAIHFAEKHEREEICEPLMKMFVVHGSVRCTDLMLAIKCSVESPLFSIISSSAHFKVNEPSSKGGYILHEIQDNDSLLAVLKLDPDLSVLDKNESTPLMIYALKSIVMANTIIKAGSPINTKDKQGNTPLHNASWSEELCAALFEKGATVDVVNQANETPLHLAVKKSLAATSLLLEHGAAANATDLNGNVPVETLLLLTGDKKYRESDAVVVFQKMLSTPGFDVNVKFKSGNTLLGIAMAYDLNQFVEILMQYENLDCSCTFMYTVCQKKYTITPLLKCFVTGNMEGALNLLQRPGGGVISETCEWNPIHLACFLGQPQILSALLEQESQACGANAKRPSQALCKMTGLSSFHTASHNHSCDCMNALLSHAKWNSSLCTPDSKTPLQFALEHLPPFTSTASLFLSHTDPSNALTSTWEKSKEENEALLEQQIQSEWYPMMQIMRGDFPFEKWEFTGIFKTTGQIVAGDPAEFSRLFPQLDEASFVEMVQFAEDLQEGDIPTLLCTTPPEHGKLVPLGPKLLYYGTDTQVLKDVKVTYCGKLLVFIHAKCCSTLVFVTHARRPLVFMWSNIAFSPKFTNVVMQFITRWNACCLTAAKIHDFCFVDEELPGGLFCTDSRSPQQQTQQDEENIQQIKQLLKSMETELTHIKREPTEEHVPDVPSEERIVSETTSIPATQPSDAPVHDLQKEALPKEEETEHTGETKDIKTVSESIVSESTMPEITPGPTTTQENAVQATTVPESTVIENPSSTTTAQETAVPTPTVLEATSNTITTQENTVSEPTVLQSAVPEETPVPAVTQEAVPETTLPKATLDTTITQETVETETKSTVPETTPEPTTTQETSVSEFAVPESKSTEQEATSIPTTTQETTAPETTLEPTTTQETSASESALAEAKTTEQEATPTPTTTQETTAPETKAAVPETTLEPTITQETSVSEPVVPEPKSTAPEITPIQTTTQETTVSEAKPAVPEAIPEPTTTQEITVPESKPTLSTTQETTVPEPIETESKSTVTTAPEKLTTPQETAFPQSLIPEATSVPKTTQETAAQSTVPEVTPVPTATQATSAAESTLPETTPITVTTQETIPTEAIPNPTAPQETITSDSTVPESKPSVAEATLEPTTTEATMQVSAVLETTSEPTTTQETSVSESAVPESKTTEQEATPIPTTTQETTAPETKYTVPETTPEPTTTQETSVSESVVPESKSTAQETTSIPTTTQETSASESALPESKTTEQEATPTPTTTQETTAPETKSTETIPEPTTTQEITVPQATSESTITQETTAPETKAAVPETTLEPTITQETSVSEPVVPEPKSTVPEATPIQTTTQETTVSEAKPAVPEAIPEPTTTTTPEFSPAEVTPDATATQQTLVSESVVASFKPTVAEPPTLVATQETIVPESTDPESKSTVTEATQETTVPESTDLEVVLDTTTTQEISVSEIEVSSKPSTVPDSTSVPTLTHEPETIIPESKSTPVPETVATPETTTVPQPLGTPSPIQVPQTPNNEQPKPVKPQTAPKKNKQTKSKSKSQPQAKPKPKPEPKPKSKPEPESKPKPKPKPKSAKKKPQKDTKAEGKQTAAVKKTRKEKKADRNNEFNVDAELEALKKRMKRRNRHHGRKH
ncbi:hypothetical protein Pelo_5742 [Pelomyxa schiedti]|nr:hypothetical protein Pelo_5742 [Pelomyxa schiedti]